MVHSFVIVPTTACFNAHYQRRLNLSLHQTIDQNTIDMNTNKEEDDNDDDNEKIAVDWNNDVDDELDDDDDDDDDDRSYIDVSEETVMNLDIDDDEDYDDDDDEYDDSNDQLENNTILQQTHLDASVQDVLHGYMEMYETLIKESSSMRKTDIIKRWLPVLTNWDTNQYNQLLKEISQIGSVHDTETILYHMIEQQQQQQQNNNNNNNSNGQSITKLLLVNDETFYHIFASYQYRQRQQETRVNYKNKKYCGIAFKVEQLLAIQDAIHNSTNNNNNERGSNVRPSIQTLYSVLNVMILDRFDPKIALRARRIWDRLLLLSESNEETSTILSNSVLLVLICCTHVPRMIVVPADKLSSFTVALDCFNWATSTTTISASTPNMTTQQQQCNVYVYFLRACRILLSETVENKRDAVIEAAFRRACINGYVNNKVLKAFEECASDALMLRLLGGFIEDGQELPTEWSRNCLISNELEASVTSS
jgi:hypothetical protein